MNDVGTVVRPRSADSFRSSALFQQILASSGLIVLLVGFSLASPNFLQTANIINILQATSVNGVLAVAATLVIISGGIDLSVGTLMTFCSVAAGVFMIYLGVPVPVGIVGTLIVGLAAGSLSGTFIAKLKIPPFIATLGMMLIYKGLSLAICGAKPIYFTNAGGFNQFSAGSLVSAVIPGVPLPNSVVVLFAVAVTAAFVLGRTALGRYTFAMGSNEEALRLSGVNIDRWKIAIYGLAGAICAVAGILIASRINSAQPAIGQGYELDAIAAVVIGGTSLSGGRGTIVGTMIGALIISVVANGLRILSVPQEWQIVVTGSIIIVAVYFDILRRRGAA
ncbi:MAG: ABC transporter permease [Devosia sp.]